MDGESEVIAKFENILKKSAHKSQISLYNNVKPLNTVNYKPDDVILNVTSQLKAIQTADRIQVDKNKLRKLSKHKSKFTPVFKLPAFDEAQPTTSKFDTQYVSNTQLLDVLQHAEDLDNPRGMTEDFETSFSRIHTEKEKYSTPELPNTKSEQCSDKNIVRSAKSCPKNDNIYVEELRNMAGNVNNTLNLNINKVEIAENIITHSHSENIKNNNHQTQIAEDDLNFDVNECQAIVYNEIEDVKNDTEICSPDILCNFEQSYYSQNDNNSIHNETSARDHSQRPLSPILNFKPIKCAAPLVYSLELFEKFETMAMPLISEQTDFNTAKHLINSQIFGKELAIHADSVNFTELQSQIIQSNEPKISSLKDIDIDENLKKCPDPIATLNKINHPVTQNELSYDNEPKIATLLSAIDKEHSKTAENHIGDVIKTGNKKIHTSIDYHDDEILFSSDEECCIPTEYQDLPFTCALETSFYDMSAVLDKTMFVAFQTASNKTIQINTDSFYKAKSILDDFDKKGLSITEMVKIHDKNTVSAEVDCIIKPEETNSNPQQQDKEGNINKIGIDSLIKEKGNYLQGQPSLLTEMDFMNNSLRTNQKYVPTDNPSFQGFTTASNKIIKLSEQALNRCRKVFQDIDIKEDFDYPTVQVNDEISDNVEKPTIHCNSNAVGKVTETTTKSDINNVTDSFIHDNINDDILLKEFENIEMTLEESFCKSNRNIQVEQGEISNEIDLSVLKEEVNNAETNAPVKTTSFVGFKTANNKDIKISVDALAKTRNIFQDIDNIDINTDKTIECNRRHELNEENNTFTSEQKKCEKTRFKLISNIDSKSNDLFKSFKAASNKHITISKDVNEQSENLLDDIQKNSVIFDPVILNDKDITLSQESNDTREFKKVRPERNVVFQTASNKPVNVSKQALAQSKAVFKNIDLNELVAGQAVNKRYYEINTIAFKGFSTASNKPVIISKEALAKSKTLFQDIDSIENVFPEGMNSSLSKVKPVKCQGSSNASNKSVNNSKQALSETKNVENETQFRGLNTVNISEQVLVKSKEIFSDTAKVDCNENFALSLRNKVQIKTSTEFQGFSTASNKPVQISKEALLKSKKLFEDIDIKECNQRPDISVEDKSKIVPSRTFKGFSTASHKPVQISEDALAQSKKLLECLDENSSDPKTIPITGDKVQIVSRTFQGFSTASNKSVEVSEEALAKSKKMLREIDSTNHKGSDKLPVNKDAFKKANTNFVRLNEDVLVERQKIQRDLDISIPERFQTINDSMVTDKNDINKVVNSGMLEDLHKSKEIDTIIDTQVIKDFDATLYTEDFQSPQRSKRSGSPILSCPRAKRRKFSTPYLSIKLDTEMIKQTTTNEKSDFIDDDYKKHKIYSLKDLLNMETDRNINHKITANLVDFENLLNITFSNERNDMNNSILTTKDVKELFLKLVNPKLIPENWIDNHLKLIIWKLLSYEIKFPTTLKNACSVKNVLRQIKYRYDKELYEAKRSALRLILEKDDIPSRTMVICVVVVYIDGVKVDSPSKSDNIELLITDGWYCLKCTVDKMLAKLVCDGRLRVGDKMITCGAELINCKGMSPWEDTSSVRLKIFGNSTRRARWDIRLGYQNMAAMTVPLSTVKLDGGKVAKLTVYVTRVYPALYVEKFEDGSTVTRSERLEHLHQMKYEAEKQMVLEKIYEEVEKEFNEQDSQDSGSSIESSNKGKCCESGSQIARMMRRCKDPVEFKHTLTLSQADLLNQYTNSRREQVLQDLQDKVRQKVDAKGLSVNRNVVPVLKVRVAGVHRGQITKGMLSIWKPTDAVQEILNEGTWIDVLNVVPTAFRYSEIHISAGRQSIFSKSTVKEIEKNDLFTKSLNRICYSIKDLMKNPSTDYNEIDTFGMVFLIDPSIEEFESRNQSFQNVYLTDSDKNLLCVNFWGGLKKFGFQNILDTGQIVACVNLQKRAGNTRKSIPQYRATEFSHFTRTPKNCDTRNFIKGLEIKFMSVNKIKFCEDCTLLKNNFSTNRYINNENISPYRFNNSDYCLKNNKVFIETPLASKKDEFTLTGLDFESTFQQSEEQLSPKTLQRKKKVNERITKLKMYGEPPPLSPMHIINKSKNACSSYKSPLISKSDACQSVTSAQKPNDSSIKNYKKETIDRSPVISMNKTFVKRCNINPVKLNFSHNISKDNDNLDET